MPLNNCSHNQHSRHSHGNASSQIFKYRRGNSGSYAGPSHQHQLDTEVAERVKFYLLKLSDVVPDSFLIYLPGVRIVSRKDLDKGEVMELQLMFGSRFSRDYLRVHAFCKLVHMLVCEDPEGRHFGPVDEAGVTQKYWTGLLCVRFRRIRCLPTIV